MKPYKIFYLNHVSYLGGAEIALLDLLTSLNRERYTPVALVPEGDLAERIRQLQIRCVPIPALDGVNRHTLSRFLWALPHLHSLIQREKPDLLYANTNFTAEYAGILSKITRIPSVGHIRDIEPLGRMGRWLVRQNTKLIAISEAVKQYLVSEHIPEPQIVKVHDGVDLQRYKPHKSRLIFVNHRDEEKNPLIIGLIGQIGERKGHRYFLEAAWMITQSHPLVKFWIVGKEPAQGQERYTNQLTEYVREHHLQFQVKFWGFRPDITEILARVDILVLPSLQEPFGKIVIEAMAMGKPVIASRVGGVPEIVVDGQTGLLIPPADSEALRQALEQLIPDRKRREQMGLNGRKRVEQYFSLEKTVRETEHVYEQILMW
jgi:glycosyltransferase involved in cell wall biosynthesis